MAGMGMTIFLVAAIAVLALLAYADSADWPG